MTNMQRSPILYIKMYLNTFEKNIPIPCIHTKRHSHIVSGDQD